MFVSLKLVSTCGCLKLLVIAKSNISGPPEPALSDKPNLLNNVIITVFLGH